MRLIEGGSIRPLLRIMPRIVLHLRKKGEKVHKVIDKAIVFK